jgi:autophagy-related protein 11
MARRTWALSIAEECDPMYKSIQTQNDQRDIINRGVGVALENLKSHVTTLERNFEEAHTWATNMLSEQNALLNDWEATLSRLGTVSAKKDFGFLLRRPSTPRGKSSGVKEAAKKSMTLQDFVDSDEVRRLAPKGSALCKSFKRSVDELGKIVRDVKKDTKTISEATRRSGPPYPTNDEAGKVIADIEGSAKKISSDYEELLSLPNNPKTVSSVSKRALSHTRDTLPTMANHSVDLSRAAQAAVQNRNWAMKEAVKNLQDISSLEYILQEVSTQISVLDVGPEATDVFDSLHVIFHLPVAYGQVLIESVRRREFNDKMKTDSSTLAEEMASFKEEEERRRKKWVKTMGDYLSGAEDVSTMGIEINLQGETSQWPNVSRKDIDTYLQELKTKPDMGPVIAELEQLVKDLDAPTRYQMRRAKAFKNGSIYDAGLGKSSLLLRGDDGTIKTLKDDKTKLEEKLKTSESRVRRLEDLLHRHGQLSRPVSGTFGIPDAERTYSSPTVAQSPRPVDELSRRSSNSSRRQSVTQSPQEKEFVQRIVTLEAALQAEKDNVSRLQKEAQAERRSSTESRDKMQEAESTTKDLMENFEARQREFDEERRLLEDETNKLKIRLEEMDDELDRLLGSRDNERGETDQRVKALEADLDKHRTEATKEAETLRSDYAQQRDRANSLEKQVSRVKEEKAKLHSKNSDLASEIHDYEKARSDHMNSLEAAHIHLSPDGSAPEDFGRLVKAIEILAEGLAIHARGSDEALAMVNGAKKSLEEELERAQKEIEDLREKLDTEEGESFSLRETLAQERSKILTLRSELEDGHNQLESLRSKFAAGETGSEALKERVAEEEHKVASLSEKLAVAESHSKSLEEELSNWQSKVQGMSESEQQLKSRMDARGVRAKDLSQRLYTQNDRMMRVLEKLGYTITREDDAMVIQRTSKVASASMVSGNTSLAEVAPSMGRSLSGSSPVRQFAAPEDLDLLYWMQAEDSDGENEKYQSFMSAIGKFDVDAFSDAVIKRARDIEHMARKYQKEARNYRDKSHRVQSEAHDKIAFRSFKEGDLALFLPTRNQATRPWAAFNVGTPHYFLREQDSHKLQTRDFLLARISKIEERVVDLSKSINGFTPDRRSSIGEASDVDDENPFELSDGLRWYMIDAAEEKPGAPSTPGLGKTTVASAHVDAKGSIRLKKTSNGDLATKTLSKSLDSRRSSSNSAKKGISSPGASGDRASGSAEVPRHLAPPPREHNDTEAGELREPAVSPDVGTGLGLESRAASYAAEEVRKDLLFGP